MDTRLIFRDYFDPIKTEGGTQTPSHGAQWFQSMVRRRAGEENPPVRLPGKAAKGQGSPYHKPTQVVEMSILRRSGDRLFRN